MFSLFQARRTSGIEIAKDHEDLLARMAQITEANQAALDALDKLHGDIDLRLIERIDDVLVPLIGASGFDEESWFQSMDFYGDGIRLLEFRPAKFPCNAIPALQALLVSEHKRFGMLCWTPLDESGSKDAVVIFGDTLIFTPKLARELSYA
jgi:hypothetical protein